MDPTPAAPDLVPPAPIGEKSALAFFFVLVGVFLAGIIAQAAQPVAGLLWTEVFAFLVPSLAAVLGSNLRPVAYLRLAPPRPRLLLLAALVGGAGYLFATGVMVIAQRLLPARWVEVFDVARLFEGPAWERISFALLAALLAPVCEEIAFRGYLLTTLGLRHRPAVAIGGAALLFALLHLDPVRFPALLVLGTVFGWLAWRAGSVWTAVVAHAVNNGIAAALALGPGVRPGAEAEIPSPAAIAATLALGALSLGLLLLGYRAATPSPPPPRTALVLRNPLDPSIRFRAGRMPATLRAVLRLGVVGLVLLAVAMVVRLATSLPHPIR